MTFAQIPIEIIQTLKGVRLTIFCAVKAEEFLGGGACNLKNEEISKKYNLNYDSFCRERKKLIAEGWLIECVGGTKTKSFNDTDISSVEPQTEFNNTDEISVKPEPELTDYQSTDEISVNQLMKYQFPTDEISGTEIAKKDLDFKECLNTSVCVTRTREDEIKILGQKILAGLRTEMKLNILPREHEYEAISEFAHINNFSAEKVILCYQTLKKQKWRKGRISAQTIKDNLNDLDKLIEDLQEDLEKQNGANKNGTIQPNSNNQTDRNESASKRIGTFEENDRILREAGIIS